MNRAAAAAQRTRLYLHARPNARCAADYQTRISGPLIDRIDLHTKCRR